MAVYERTYRPYAGSITPQRLRFLVLPQYAYREIFAKRLFVAFFASCFLWPLILAVLIYLPHNVNFLKVIQAQAGADLFGFSLNESFFYRAFMVPHGWLAFVMAFILGPALISADQRNNAMPMFLSRPFSRWEYIAGKISIMAILLSLITWVPGLALFGLQSYLAGTDWFREHYGISIAIFLSSWILITLLCLISLSLSAYVKWKQLARIGLFGVFIVSGGLATMMNVLLRTDWASVLDLGAMIRVVWRSLFSMPDGAIPPGVAWLSVLIFCGLGLTLLVRKIRAYEIVRS